MRMLQRVTFPSESVDGLYHFEKSEHFLRGLYAHTCPSYRNILLAQDCVWPSDANKKNGYTLLSSNEVLNYNSNRMSAVEALVLLRDFSMGYFFGSFIVNHVAEYDLPIPEGINFADGHRFSLCHAADFISAPIGSDTRLKSVFASAAPMMRKALNTISITIEINLAISGSTNEKIVFSEALCGNEGIQNANLCSVNDSALIERILDEFGQFECSKESIRQERALISALLHHLRNGSIFFFQRHVDTNIKFIPELEEYSQLTEHIFNELMMKQIAIRHAHFENIVVLNKAYRSWYYISLTVEGRCPWIQNNGHRNMELFLDLIAGVLSCLSSKPGSPVEVLHAKLDILSLLQTSILLSILVTDGLIESREVLCSDMDACDMFHSNRDERSEPKRTSLFFLAHTSVLML